MKKKIINNFNYLKKILNDKFMLVDEVDGFYFPTLAIELVRNSNRNFFMNEYYNLTISDILNMTSEANSLTDVKKHLFNEYKTEYADSWYQNYLQVIESIKIQK